MVKESALFPALFPVHNKNHYQRKRQQERLRNLILLVKNRKNFYHHGKESAQENIAPEEPEELQGGEASFFDFCKGENDAQWNCREEEGVYIKDIDVVVGIIVIGEKGHKKEQAAGDSEE